MKSIQRRIKNEKERQSDMASSYTIFRCAIRDQKYSKEQLARYFSKYVDKDDYARKDKKEILSDLATLLRPLTLRKTGGKGL